MPYLITLIVQRLLMGAGLLLATSALIFAGTEILPGDVAQSIPGQSATPEALANLRRDLGLEQPALTRYLGWLAGIATGDLGTALTNGTDIADAIG
jgi:peptide/nickel transport system permease protein